MVVEGLENSEKSKKVIVSTDMELPRLRAAMFRLLQRLSIQVYDYV